MANIFLDLPVPTANGSGAGVATDAMGEKRTVTLQGDLLGAVTVEYSQDDVNYAPLFTFSGSGKRTFSIAARFMRATVTSYQSGTGNMDVAANDNGTEVASIAAPPANGAGASTDVSALGTFNTVNVGGLAGGNVLIQISEDGVDWVDCLSFSANGGKSKVFVAQFIRAFGQNAGGTPVIQVCAVDDATSAGGTAGPFDALNYKMVGDAPNSGATPSLLSQVGGAAPTVTLQTVHCKAAGFVVGLRTLIDPALSDPDDRIVLEVEISTDAGVSFAPLNTGVLQAGPIVAPLNKAEAIFAPVAGNAFAAGDLLRLVGRYSSVATPSAYTGLMTGEIDVA